MNPVVDRTTGHPRRQCRTLIIHNFKNHAYKMTWKEQMNVNFFNIFQPIRWFHLNSPSHIYREKIDPYTRHSSVNSSRHRKQILKK